MTRKFVWTDIRDESTNKAVIMEDLLQNLEKKIKELIGQHDSLKHSNHLLNQGKHVLALEKEALLVRQQKAVVQIEGLVSRLKALGSDYE